MSPGFQILAQICQHKLDQAFCVCTLALRFVATENRGRCKCAHHCRRHQRACRDSNELSMSALIVTTGNFVQPYPEHSCDKLESYQPSPITMRAQVSSNRFESRSVIFTVSR